ncbi:DUF1641 domain-containing protein [Mesobacillus maritimus]|uniref:DUF1641 domain-containing protein n=1 Tax=Mesobacillus maritimus TaxID=1643336 RepID=UPI002040659F|nr:DUF1641 domain-containing protein [Mesobacillus maritimus]MCM3587577.1 DUF1641 domain-containing protein [Mesobacillus maritimus]MCM3672001.1 DUF1641 domain-containing protein [Mesobacillus maritimus]
MAKAIRQINKSTPNPVEEQMQAVTELMNAVTANKDALITTIDIIKGLNEMGVLDAAKAMLEQRTDIGAIAIQQLNQPNMHNTIKNGMNALKFIGSINPEQLQSILNGVTQGFERSAEVVKNGENQSLWKLGTSLRDPDVKASLSTMMEFLHGMGEAFNQDPQQGVH